MRAWLSKIEVRLFKKFLKIIIRFRDTLGSSFVSGNYLVMISSVVERQRFDVDTDLNPTVCFIADQNSDSDPTTTQGQSNNFFLSELDLFKV